MPFGFHLAADTLPSGVLRGDGFRSALSVSGFRLRARLGFSIPSYLSPASEALPPLSDMAPLIRAPEGLQPSGTTRCPAHTMPAADSCAALSVPCGPLSPESRDTAPSRLRPSDLRRNLPYKYWALMILDISPGCVASYPLPVRQASALPSASFRFAVARDTLAVQLTLPLVGRAEDFHLQVSAPCRAHQKKSRAIDARLFHCRQAGQLNR